MRNKLNTNYDSLGRSSSVTYPSENKNSNRKKRQLPLDPQIKMYLSEIAMSEGVTLRNNEYHGYYNFLKRTKGIENEDMLEKLYNKKLVHSFSPLWKEILNELASPNVLTSDEDYAEFMDKINESKKLIINNSKALKASPTHTIPYEIIHLHDLGHLEITSCDLNDYGMVIENLPKLWLLKLANNEFVQLPPSTFVTHLSMSDNKISNPDLSGIMAIKNLYLDHNMIEELPYNIDEFLPNLNTFYLNNNPIRELPSKLANIESLVTLAIYTTNIKSLPVPICHRIKDGTLTMVGSEKLVKHCKTDLFNEELQWKTGEIMYQPGSRWMEFQRFGIIDPKEQQILLMKEIKLPHKKLRRQEWKVICSQLGEMRKDELIDILLDLGLEGYVRNRMSKKELCNVARKYIPILNPDMPKYKF